MERPIVVSMDQFDREGFDRYEVCKESSIGWIFGVGSER